MQRAALLLSTLVLLTSAACTAASSDGGTSEADETSATARTIFEGPSSSRELAGDAKYVYWTDGAAQEVLRMPRAGGPTTVLWHGHGADSVGRIVVDAGVVYFTEDGRILAVPSEGGTVQELVRLSKEGPTNLAADGDYVYWGGTTDFAVGYMSYIRRVKKTGGSYETVYTGYKGVDSLAAVGGQVFFAGNDWDIVANPPERLMRVAGSGGEPVQLLEVPGVIRAITVDDENVYLSTHTDLWRVESVPLAGGAAKTLVAIAKGSPDVPDALVAGTTAVFWTSAGTFNFANPTPDNHDAHVYSVAKSGGARKLVAREIDSPYSLAITGDCPVWTAKTAIQAPATCL